MKRFLFSFLTMLFFASLAHAIEAGDPEDEVTIALGKPVAILKKADGAEVWKFTNGTTVWLVGGIVQKITTPTVGNLIRRADSTVWIPAPSRKVLVKPAPTALPAVVESRPADDRFRIVFLVFFGGLAAFVLLNLRSWTIFLKEGGASLVDGVFVPMISLVSPARVKGRSENDREWRYH